MTSGYVCFCGNPIPIMGNVLWCDSCIEEFLHQHREDMDAFMARKRTELKQKQLRETPPEGIQQI